MPENSRSGETAAGGDEASPGRIATRRCGVLPHPVLVVRGCRCGSCLGRRGDRPGTRGHCAWPRLVQRHWLLRHTAPGSFASHRGTAWLTSALGLWRRRRSPRRTATGRVAAAAASRARQRATPSSRLMISAIGAAVLAARSTSSARSRYPRSWQLAPMPTPFTTRWTARRYRSRSTGHRGRPRAWPTFVLHPRGRLKWGRQRHRLDRLPVVRQPRLARHQHSRHRLATATDPTLNRSRPGTFACVSGLGPPVNATRLGVRPEPPGPGGETPQAVTWRSISRLQRFAAGMRAWSNCGGTVPIPAAVVATYPAVNPVSVWLTTTSPLAL